jgi:hypothetical protein
MRRGYRRTLFVALLTITGLGLGSGLGAQQLSIDRVLLAPVEGTYGARAHTYRGELLPLRVVITNHSTSAVYVGIGSRIHGEAGIRRAIFAGGMQETLQPGSNVWSLWVQIPEDPEMYGPSPLRVLTIRVFLRVPGVPLSEETVSRHIWRDDSQEDNLFDLNVVVLDPTHYDVTVRVTSLTVHDTCDDIDDCWAGGRWLTTLEEYDCALGPECRGQLSFLHQCQHRPYTRNWYPELTFERVPADRVLSTILEVRDLDPACWPTPFGCWPFANVVRDGGFPGSIILTMTPERWQRGERIEIDPLPLPEGSRCHPGSVSATVEVSSRFSL